MSSIRFLRSRISFSLFFSFSSCSFLVSAMVSLFFSATDYLYLALLLFPPTSWKATPVNHYTPSASVCIDASWQIYLITFLHNRHHLILLSFEIPLQIHYSFFDFILAGPVLISALLFDHFLEHSIPSCFCRSCTLLFRICTLSASSSGP